MAVRVTYHCPSCGSDINSQYWLPATHYVTACKACGKNVVRTGASIRDDWSWAFAYLGFLPLWAMLCFMPGMGKESIGSRILIGFLAALFSTVGLSILGWIVGMFVSLFAPRQPKGDFNPFRL